MAFQSIAAFIVAGVGLGSYYFYEKNRLAKEMEANRTNSYGKPSVGGPFTLVNQDGLPVTDKDFLGKYMLIYFGYTFCPDICPEELERMAQIVDQCIIRLR